MSQDESKFARYLLAISRPGGLLIALLKPPYLANHLPVKVRVSKARAAHNRRSSLNASPVPCRLSFQGPRPPSHEDTHTTNDTAMRDTPASARATQPGLSCAAAPSKTAAPQDALARSSAGSYAQT
eukprot:scaffold125665_cov21-Tisochrysis_lutea.AAC.1